MARPKGVEKAVINLDAAPKGEEQLVSVIGYVVEKLKEKDDQGNDITRVLHKTIKARIPLSSLESGSVSETYSAADALVGMQADFGRLVMSERQKLE